MMARALHTGMPSPHPAPENASYVRFANVQKTYDGEVLVVRNLDLDIPQGEFLTLLGPSGSGKTTSLMMLAGFETPTQGKILLEGQELNRVPPHRRNIGMVFQNYALFPHMTVEENLAFPLKVRKKSASDISDKVMGALRMVHLEDFAKRRPQQLSGGQQQRVAVARALVFEPSIVLMDEPLGALDKNLREELQYEIKNLHDQLGITMVYVTHDQSEALTMSDRIAVFDQGCIQQCGDPRALYEQPGNAFVASFIGENNKIFGTVEHKEHSRCVVRVENEETTVNALRIGDLDTGDRCLLSVRPECVFINPEPGQTENEFTADIKELLFKGDHLRVRISTCGSDNFVVKVPNPADISALTPGNTVRIGWNAKLCRALSLGDGPSG